MKRRLFLCSSIAAAQEAVAPMPLAIVLDAEGRLTPIFGLPGNFISGPPGEPLLAYSNDGRMEWRLEPGKISVLRQGRTTHFPTTATTAVFRGEFVLLPETGETYRLFEDSLICSSDEPNLQLAGRALKWQDGKLQIFQADGSVEEVACPLAPESMTAAGPEWGHLRMRGQSYLLRLTAGRVALFVLPQRRRT